MQNGLTANQAKHTKKSRRLFLDKPFCPAQGQKNEMGSAASLTVYYLLGARSLTMQKFILILCNLVGLCFAVQTFAGDINQLATNQMSSSVAITNAMRLPSDAELQAGARFSVSQYAISTEKKKSLSVTTNDVVLIKRPSGAVTVIQFTSFDPFATSSVPLSASYRWRYRSALSQVIQSGKGRVCESYDRKPSADGKSFDVTPKADHDTTVRAGDIWIEWSYHTESSSWLYYYPSRATIQILNSDAFDRAL